MFRSFRASDLLPAYLGRRCVRLPADFALPQAGLLWPFGPEIRLRSPEIPDEPFIRMCNEDGQTRKTIPIGGIQKAIGKSSIYSCVKWLVGRKDRIRHGGVPGASWTAGPVS